MIGFSAYSMVNRIKNGMMTVLDVINFSKGTDFRISADWDMRDIFNR